MGSLGPLTTVLGMWGPIGLGVATVVALAAPLVDRYLVRRKRLQYRVLYNSKIGLSPENWLDDDRERPDSHATEELVRLGRQLQQMSTVVIRFRNIGSRNIVPGDFGGPITVRFGDRIVLDARISDIGRDKRSQVIEVDGLDKRVRKAIQLTSRAGDPVVQPVRLTTLRQVMRSQFERWFQTQDDPGFAEPAPQLDTILINGLALKPRERFKLVVVLREREDRTVGADNNVELTKTVDVDGTVANRSPGNQKYERTVTWQRVSGVVGALLVGVLIASLWPWPARAPSPSTSCAPGRLGLTGSTAFAPVMSGVAAQYQRACGAATITVDPSGSVDGVRLVEQGGPGRDRNHFGALSDGRTTQQAGDLVEHPVGLIVYSLVVNAGVGVDRLGLDQIRGIYNGTYRDWQQVRPGPSLPIRLVSRGEESGTRVTFEGKVLGFGEGKKSSDDCVVPSRTSDSPTVRCERPRTEEVVDQVASTPGAIGYADTPAVGNAIARNAGLSTLKIDGRDPDPKAISAGYPFWTVEYLYTKGVPDNSSVMKSLIDYLSNGAARAELQDSGYTPCVTKDGQLLASCREPGG